MLGMSPDHYRQTVARMAHEAWVALLRSGQRNSYSMNSEMAQRLVEGSKLILHAAENAVDLPNKG
jgi:DNA-binding transcriptional regulator PaaX